MRYKELQYPIKFHPILKEKIWGGKKLSKLFNKEGGDFIGESWELSAVEGNVSVVKNGTLQGKTLVQLISVYKDKLVGKNIFKTYGTNFPLLFKFIDAAQDLSVQLHPDDALAKKKHNSFGKTEMWYILQAEKDAKLILGLTKEISKENCLEFLSKEKIETVLKHKSVTRGDSFFIAPGTVHAIGSGIVLAEIQQSSDITYRLYDWNRVGLDGKPRQLHLEQALDAIDFNIKDPEIKYKDIPNTPVTLVSNPYFHVNKLLLSENYIRNVESLDSFVVYMCVMGSAAIMTKHFSENINLGETVLIPAVVKDVIIETKNAVFLEIYIQ